MKDILLKFLSSINEFNLHSIFHDIYITLSIPDYFENRESRVICYKCNKPIRNTIIFIFNKRISDLYIHTNTPDT